MKKFGSEEFESLLAAKVASNEPIFLKRHLSWGQLIGLIGGFILTPIYIGLFWMGWALWSIVWGKKVVVTIAGVRKRFVISRSEFRQLKHPESKSSPVENKANTATVTEDQTNESDSKDDKSNSSCLIKDKEQSKTMTTTIQDETITPNDAVEVLQNESAGTDEERKNHTQIQSDVSQLSEVKYSSSASQHGNDDVAADLVKENENVPAKSEIVKDNVVQPKTSPKVFQLNETNVWGEERRGQVHQDPIIRKIHRSLKDFVVFDIETSGFSPRNDAIIQLSAVKVKNDQIVDQFDEFVNPHREVEAKIVYLTGIRPTDMQDADDIEPVMQRFMTFVGNLPLVGHNIVKFDIPFILANGFYEDQVEVLDTWNLAQDRDFPEELPNLKLPTLKKYFGVVNRSHNALNDSLTEFVLYQHLRDNKLSRVEIKLDDEPQTLAGLRFVVTGDFMEAPREEIVESIKAHGGRATGSVSGKTDYLVLGTQVDSRLKDGVHSKKELDAIARQEEGGKIQIIGYDALQQLMDGKVGAVAS